jgi:hypothetical protein
VAKVQTGSWRSIVSAGRLDLPRPTLMKINVHATGC